MSQRIFAIAAVACVGMMGAACDDNNMACSPGDLEVCQCSGEGTGVHECNGKGKWGSCDGCEGGSEGCLPGELQTCPCVGGGEGIQECAETGDNWGECEGCGAMGDCDYTACTGDICSEPEDCCENTGCGSFIFTESWGASENYCYPMCDPEDADPCKCGDVCLDFGEGFATCLGTGELSVSNLTLPVGADVDAAVVLYTDEVDVNYNAELSGEQISFDAFYAYWTEYESSSTGDLVRELFIRADGVVGSDGIWITFISIPEAIMAEGVGEYPVYDEETDEFNFSVELYSGTLDTDFYLEEVWLESLMDNAVLGIQQTCDPCSLDDTECDACEFSMDALLLAMRTKLSL